MENQSSLHTHFEKIFIVNLPHQRERKLKTFFALKKLGISAEIWEATDGFSTENQLEYNLYKTKEPGDLKSQEFSEIEKNRQSLFISSPGAWGYLKTYKSILRHSHERGYKKILILEDDILIHRQFEDKVKHFFDSIGEDWKIIQFGASQYDWSSVDIAIAQEKGYYSPRILHTCGSFAMGIDMSIAEELIEYVDYMESPFDYIPLGKMYEKYLGRCYVLFPNIVIADVTSSSIRESRDQISHSEKMKWALEAFEFPRQQPVISIVFTNPVQISGISFDSPVLRSTITLNWLFDIAGQIRPVHSNESPILKLSAEGHAKTWQTDVQKITTDHPGYVILLTEERKYTENELLQLVDNLIINDECSIGAKVLYKRPETEYPLPANQRVSIIIPTYQRSENLQAAVDSALNQTYEDIEVIVVDDNEPGSEERSNTINVLLKYQGDPRVRSFFHETNLNAAAARNTGLIESTGSYVAFLDDDDVYLPNKIEVCIRELQKLDEAYGGVYGGYLGGAFATNEELSRFKSGDLTLEILKLNYRGHYLNTDTTLYRKSALLAINGYDDSFSRHQDLELNLRFFQVFKIGVVHEVVAHVRPTATKRNNLIAKSDFFILKLKYLKKFEKIIRQYPPAIQRDIYRQNWNDVMKHFASQDEFIQNCIDCDPAGIIAFLCEIDPGIKNVTSATKNEMESLYDRVKKLEVENQKLDEYNKDLLTQKDWYENTYERLPYWWKKVGSLLRKLKKF